MLTKCRRTPLHVACENNAPLPVVQLLVQAYPEAFQACDKNGWTPLHLACRKASLDVIRLLAPAEAPWVCLLQDNDRRLPLDAAKLWNRNDDAIEFLTSVTRAAASVLADKVLMSKTTVLPETYGHVATFVHGLPEKVAILKMGLTKDAIHALLERDNVRTMIRVRVLNVIANE